MTAQPSFAFVKPPAHDAGGSRRLPLLPGVRGSAKFSPCGRYRYWLRRDWGPDDAPFLLSVGLNPSTAEANIDDPTLRRDQALAHREGFTSLLKINICDYRATHPRDLAAHDVIPCSDHNRVVIREFGQRAAKVFVCWGSPPESIWAYADLAMTLLPKDRLWCLGTTASGAPRHPLYIAGDKPLELWRPIKLVQRP